MSNWAKKIPAVAIALVAMIALVPAANAYALGASTGGVKGYVKSAMTGAAMSEVTVKVFDMNSAEFVAEVVTAEDGSLDLSELPFGLYQVTVVAPEGYASAAGPLVSLNEDNPEATVGFDLEAVSSAAPVAQMSGGLLAALLAAGVGAGLGIAAAAGAFSSDTP